MVLMEASYNENGGESIFELFLTDNQSTLSFKQVSRRKINQRRTTRKISEGVDEKEEPGARPSMGEAGVKAGHAGAPLNRHSCVLIRIQSYSILGHRIGFHLCIIHIIISYL